MARLTKPIVIANTLSAIRADNTIKESAALVTQRAKSIGPRSYTNIFGELIEDGAVPLVPEIHPLFVSQNNTINPFLYYLLDKLSEGFTTSFDEWQVSTRIRGRTNEDGEIIEGISGILLNETVVAPTWYPAQGMSDTTTRNRLLDISVSDLVTPLPAQLAIMLGCANAITRESSVQAFDLDGGISS